MKELPKPGQSAVEGEILEEGEGYGIKVAAPQSLSFTAICTEFSEYQDRNGPHYFRNGNVHFSHGESRFKATLEKPGYVGGTSDARPITVEIEGDSFIGQMFWEALQSSAYLKITIEPV